MLSLLFGKGEVALEVGGERGPTAVELGADAVGFGTEGVLEILFFDAGFCECPGEPVGGVAEIESDGRDVGRDDAAGGGPVARGPGGVRGDAAPADGTGEAKIVEPRGGVVGDASGQERALPLDRGSFEAFELRECLEQAVFAGELGLVLVEGGEVLPAEEPTHVGCGRNGLDASTEGGEGEAVDALEEAAIAPLDVVNRGGCGGFKGAAHDEALHLSGEESGVEGGGVEVE